MINPGTKPGNVIDSSDDYVHIYGCITTMSNNEDNEQYCIITDTHMCDAESTVSQVIIVGSNCKNIHYFVNFNDLIKKLIVLCTIFQGDQGMCKMVVNTVGE